VHDGIRHKGGRDRQPQQEIREPPIVWVPMSTPFIVSAEVAAALAANSPVVALESTIISHGLPRPRNHEAAREFEQILRDAGVTPATIAVLDGVPRIGLDADGVRRIAEEELAKASVRDLPVLAAAGASGATTVAATAHLAALAGVRVFATGGLGGVHRGAGQTFDESADLSTLAVTPVTVVSAGVKSVLDIAATLERLETLSVPVVGYRTRIFPSFWLTESAHAIDWSVDSAAQVAAIMRSQDALGRGQGIVVANPIPRDLQWDPTEHDRVLAEALAAADAAGIHGKAVTPFLLGFIVTASGGRSLEVNLDLARNNVRLAAEIAIEWAALVARD
jgi:pseudouridine-5'-phosphate glycosidase